jgi:hypothetical protein
MANTDLAIKIATTLDATGLNKADKAVNKFNKNVGRLGRSLGNLAGVFGVTFSTVQIVNFGRASVRAFAQMQAEQDRLTRLMKVGTGASSAQIQSLNSQAMALENLGVVTKGNITQVQSQLATFNLQADTIAKLTPSILDYVTAEKGATASTEQFKQMTNGLAQALNGNFTSLTRVGFVIDATTKDLIKNGTEAERAAAIVKVLDSTYKGFNASLRDTPIGQMQLLAAAADNARETIGEGLLDALALLGGTGTKDIEKATGAMNDFSVAFADVIRGQAVVASKAGGAGGGSLNKIGNFLKIYYKEVLGIQALQDLGAATRPRPRANRLFAGGSSGNVYDPAAALAARREKERLALAKKQLDSQKKLNAEQKKQLALKKAGSIFDLEQIQVVAALKGKLSDEDRKKVELQFALLTGNTKQATALTLEIAKAQGLGKDLAEYLANIPDAKNPFASWEAYLDMLMAKAQKVASVGATAVVAATTSMNTGGASSIYLGGTKVDIPATNVATMPKPAVTATSGGGQQATTYVGGTPIYVQIDGKTIASALQDSSLSGIGSSVNRTGR